jgi:ABC-type transport system involved in multi-copper enzyme maturation permease subunit
MELLILFIIIAAASLIWRHPGKAALLLLSLFIVFVIIGASQNA